MNAQYTQHFVNLPNICHTITLRYINFLDYDVRIGRTHQRELNAISSHGSPEAELNRGAQGAMGVCSQESNTLANCFFYNEAQNRGICADTNVIDVPDCDDISTGGAGVTPILPPRGKPAR
jgi:hypothetical protein